MFGAVERDAYHSLSGSNCFVFESQLARSLFAMLNRQSRLLCSL